MIHKGKKIFRYLQEVNKQEQGFTLLELLVASVIFTLVLTGIYSIFVHPVRSLEVEQSSILATREIRMIYQKISSDLASVILPSIINPYIFHGSSQSFQFAYLDNDGVISESIYGKGLAAKSNIFYEFFLDKDIRIEYYDNEQLIWRNSWHSDQYKGIPSLVRMTFLPGTIDTEAIVFTWAIYGGRKIIRRGSFD